MSLSNLPPSGELGAWRVMEPSPVDFASVEYVVLYASIAESAMVQNSPSGYGPIDTCIWIRFAR